MSDLLTVSRLRSARKCARLEWIEYVERWRPVREAEALRVGSLWHLAMEHWWNAWREGAASDALARALAAIAGRAADQFEQVRVEEMVRGYDAYWSGQEFDEIVGVEDEFRAPLVNPDTMATSRTWRLAGKIDARVVMAGRRLIVEHKTSSEDISPAADYWAKLQMDHQLSIYMIGAETLGWPPEGCLYDVVVKPGLRPLKATPKESRKYKGNGELYASQRWKDEEPEEYRARVREAIAAEPERYFARRDVPRLESQIKEFLQDAWQQGRSMRENHLAKRASRNPEACHAYGTCPYWRMCSTGADLGDYPSEFRRIEFVHPELTTEDSAAA